MKVLWTYLPYTVVVQDTHQLFESKDSRKQTSPSCSFMMTRCRCTASCKLRELPDTTVQLVFRQPAAEILQKPSISCDVGPWGSLDASIWLWLKMGYSINCSPFLVRKMMINQWIEWGIIFRQSHILTHIPLLLQPGWFFKPHKLVGKPPCIISLLGCASNFEDLWFIIRKNHLYTYIYIYYNWGIWSINH